MITNSKIGHYGRLGNQMFQYSLLYAVGKKNGYEVVLPIDNQSIVDGRYNPVILGHDKYGLDLYRCFDINARSADNFEIEDWGSEYFFREQHVSEEEIIPLGYDPSVFDVSDGTNFEGYFQYWKYFEDCFDEIKSEFEFAEPVLQKADELFSEMVNPDKIKVSIHVRRGDGLVDNGQFQVFLGLEYYYLALNILATMGIKNPQVLVFSDDIKWCRANMRFGDTVYVDTTAHDTGYVRSHYVDLCLMSKCDHNIIANSTYSWWAAFLNKNENVKVVAPKIWWGWGNRHNEEEYIRLPHWILA